MIGSDHRYTDGSAPARSDTLMLVRIDPRTHLISLLSLPRDLWVDIPGHGQDKINAAYSDGGPKLALETVKQVTGLHVNYLIGVNFHSFVSLVNDLGGVYVPVDQAYIHTEAENNALPVSERWSAIDIQPGYQLLNGSNALAFSRFRHTDSDFYRTARQQAFLHAFEQGVGALPRHQPHRSRHDQVGHRQHLVQRRHRRRVGRDRHPHDAQVRHPRVLDQ